MEKETLNVSEELKKLEALIGKIIVESAQDEIGESKRQIAKLSSNMKDLLIHEAGFPPNIASTFVQNMNEKLVYDVGKNIVSSRENEFEETKDNLSTVEQSTQKGTLDRLDAFEQDGVAVNNRKYGQNLDQICEEVFRECKMRLSRVNSRQVDNAIYDIREMMNRTSNNLQEIHEDFSKDIVKEVAKKVDDLGIRLNDEILDKVEAEVVRLGQEHGLIDKEPEKTVIVDAQGKRHEITDPDELEKIDKKDAELAKKFMDSTTETPTSVTGVDGEGNVHTTTDPEEIKKIEDKMDKVAEKFNDFASSLQSQTKSEEEMAREDANNLSDNERAFRSDPARDENTKKDLESMFK